MLLSARTESNQRCAKGCVSDERLRAAGVQSRPTPWTPIYESGPLRITESFRRAKSSSVSVLLPGLRPYQFKIYRRTALPYTAWCLLTCLVRQVSGGLNLLTHKKVGATEMSLLQICFLRAQKGNEVSHKVLCQAFFQESGGRRGETKFRRKFFVNFFKKVEDLLL